METLELIKKVRKIEIRTKGLSNQIFSGQYHSAFKGRGMAFAEVRDYQYGDDIRNIDWNVTARMNHPYMKEFEEERELTVMLLVDVSASESFGTRSQIKREMITELCAVLAFSAIQNNDNIGMIFFSDKIEKYIPPKKGKSHILRLIRELIEFEPEHHKTNIEEALRFLNNVMKKRSIAFILSDFLDKGYEQALDIISRKHDAIALHIYDKAEEELPDLGIIKLRDYESGDQYLADSSNKSVRAEYSSWWKEKQEEIENTLNRSKVDSVKIHTDEAYIAPLKTLFKKRTKRK